MLLSDFSDNESTAYRMKVPYDLLPLTLKLSSDSSNKDDTLDSNAPLVQYKDSDHLVSNKRSKPPVFIYFSMLLFGMISMFDIGVFYSSANYFRYTTSHIHD